MIFTNKCFLILEMLLQHLGDKCKLPTRNREEPDLIITPVFFALMLILNILLGALGKDNILEI